MRIEVSSAAVACHLHPSIIVPPLLKLAWLHHSLASSPLWLSPLPERSTTSPLSLAMEEKFLACSVLCEDEKQAVAVKSQLQKLAGPMYQNVTLKDLNPRVEIHYGIPSTASILAFDPFQRLLAIGTLMMQKDRYHVGSKIRSGAIVLRICVNIDTNVSRVLSIVVGTESMSAFPVITCFLSDLKILNSELGRLASSSSLIYDICSVVSIVIFKISFMLKGEKAFANTLGSITSAAFLLAIAVFLVRPAALWVIKKTPEGKPVREIYLCSFIMLLIAFTFVSQITGQGYVMAPFIFGLAIPYGPPLGSALEEKFDCFISVLLMPIFYTLCGLKTDFFTLDGNVWVVQVVILSCFIGKTIG
ncbi:hypothetical protein IFM89_029161, partial [Coptis chinensis]